MYTQTKLEHKRLYRVISCLALSFVAFFFFSCSAEYSSGGKTGSADTGFYSFSIKWPEGTAVLESNATVSRAVDCATEGINTVIAAFYDSDGNILNYPPKVSDCLDHNDSITGLPAGSNYRLLVTCEDASGTVLFEGESLGITIVAGKTTQGGEIQMTVVTTPTCTDSDSDTYYAESGCGTTVDCGDNDDTIYPSATEVCDDNKDNDCDGNTDCEDTNCFDNAACMTTNEPPIAPTNISAVPGDGEIALNWDSVFNAVTYNLYWLTTTGVSKTNYEGTISNITTNSYTHTGLVNGIIYYYVVTAQNPYGESDDSEELFATPVENYIPLLLETDTINSVGEKHYYEVTVSSGENLFINLNIDYPWAHRFYLYAKYGSLPTETDYDAISNSGSDEAIGIFNTQAGTYYIMIFADGLYSLNNGNYTITGATKLPILNFEIPIDNSIVTENEKHYYQVTIPTGENLFINLNIDYASVHRFYLYAKFGSLPTQTDYDTISNTGDDEIISIFNTQAGTYYIMIFADGLYSLNNGNYTITASTSL